MPFNGMLAGDAYLWSRSRDDDALQENLNSLQNRNLITGTGTMENRRPYRDQKL